MKLILALISFLTVSVTVFASNEAVTVGISSCGSVSSAHFQYCYRESLDDAGSKIFQFEIQAENTSLKISSTQLFEGVDPAALSAGIQNIGYHGIDADTIAFIAGPVRGAMRKSVSDPTSNALSLMQLRLAKRISIP